MIFLSESCKSGLRDLHNASRIEAANIQDKRRKAEKVEKWGGRYDEELTKSDYITLWIWAILTVVAAFCSVLIETL